MPRRLKDDCLRQCVARVTGYDPRRVPHFVRDAGRRWQYRLAVWCQRTGHAMIYARYSRASRFGTGGRVGQLILIGVTRRGTSHAVVADRYGVPIYDGGNPLRSVQHALVICRVSTPKRRKRGGCHTRNSV